MLTKKEIRNYVLPNNFGLEKVEIEGLEDYAISSGIRLCLDSEKDIWLPYILKAVEHVSRGDTGGFYGYGEEDFREYDLKCGRAFFECDSPIEDMKILVHQQFCDDSRISKYVMYFPFER